jgi:hypothetical protein
MSVEFAAATQYVRDLSNEHQARPARESQARRVSERSLPPGYLNDVARKLVVKGQARSPCRGKDCLNLCAERQIPLGGFVPCSFSTSGIKTRATKRWKGGGGKPLSRDQVSHMLTNPFYIGFFRYAGELYEGKHPPLISKKLFDKVQEVLKERGRPRHEPENDPSPLCGLTALRRVRHEHHGRGESKEAEERQRPYLRLLPLYQEGHDLLSTLHQRGSVGRRAYRMSWDNMPCPMIGRRSF